VSRVPDRLKEVMKQRSVLLEPLKLLGTFVAPGLLLRISPEGTSVDVSFLFHESLLVAQA
jgi:hypothetical protein